MADSTPRKPRSAPVDEDAAIAALSFEQAQAELEEIVSRIEEGDIAIDDSVAAYARGMRLKAHCRGILDRTEQQFADLTRQVRGESVENVDASRPNKTAK